MEDIEHNRSLYVLEELFTEDEIKEPIKIFTDLSKSYRYVHVELKNMLGEDYEARYPEYGKTSENLVSYIKTMKFLLRKKKNELQEAKNNEVSRNVENETDILNQKVNQVNLSIDILIVKNENEINKAQVQSANH